MRVELGKVSPLRQAMTVAARLQGKLKLTTGEWAVLVAWLIDEPGYPVAESVLAERTGMAVKSVSRAMVALAKKGLIEKLQGHDFKTHAAATWGVTSFYRLAIEAELNGSTSKVDTTGSGYPLIVDSSGSGYPPLVDRLPPNSGEVTPQWGDKEKREKDRKLLSSSERQKEERRCDLSGVVDGESLDKKSTDVSEKVYIPESPSHRSSASQSPSKSLLSEVHTPIEKVHTPVLVELSEEDTLIESYLRDCYPTPEARSVSLLEFVPLWMVSHFGVPDTEEALLNLLLTLAAQPPWQEMLELQSQDICPFVRDQRKVPGILRHWERDLRGAVLQLIAELRKDMEESGQAPIAQSVSGWELPAASDGIPIDLDAVLARNRGEVSR